MGKLELFSILCDTCAAKLRVTRPNAVGQVLACPKCQSMVRVVPPDNWQPSPEVAKSLSSEDLQKIRDSIATSSGNFEDIEDVLKNTPAPPPAKRKRKPGQHPQKQPAALQKPVAAPTPAPMLPTNDWTSDQAKKKRRVLIMITAGIAALIIIGALLATLYVNETPPDPVAKNDAVDASDPNLENPETPPAIDTEADSSAPNSADANPDSTPTTGEAVASNDSSNSGSTTKIEPIDLGPPATIDNSPDNQPPPVAPDSDLPPEIPMDETPDSADTTAKPPTNPLASLLDEPEIADSDDLVNRDIFGNATNDGDELGTLAELLDKANTSISEIQDLAAEIEDQETLGLAKYFVDRPDKLELEVSKKLSLPCHGLLLKDTPVAAFLREVTAVTGVPFSYDVDSFRAENVGFRLPTSIKLEYSSENRLDFSHAVDSVLATHNLKRTESNQTVVLSAGDTSETITDSYPIPKFVNTPQLQESLPQLIKLLIAPESWETTVDAPSISLVDGRLEIVQSKQVQLQIRRMFEQLAIAESGGPIPTRWSALEPMLSQAPNLKRTLPDTIEGFLAKVEKNTDLTILVDWPELQSEGWNPLASLPGNINEATSLEVLQEIARAMKLAVRAVDEQTVELTTFKAIANRSEVEVYFYGDIIEGALKQDQLFRIVDETIGRQLRSNPHVRMEYLPQINCIVSVAPQSLQRQLELVLNKLRKVGR